ncbi:hypothetical protein FISHEDRAFT_75739 [Fistulina hepatica ATCC 64428]|uniref:Uncharacterized protein n=1 Tax=Fistulina hepatica ATCC 64428 TaxID=1128425 RepID=A0A0D7A7H0_9AGAR|nr:hypothetical protein FISHEDRAFT_75739 [Fistulina hepatica ATCC 64428]
MAASFAAYASQFINRQQQQQASGSVSASQQPIFFSFTTDDGSRAARSTSSLDDTDDPHLRLKDADEEDDDPYLRLDDMTGRGSELGESSHGGWLAHQYRSPPQRFRGPQSPQEQTDIDGDDDSDEDERARRPSLSLSVKPAPPSLSIAHSLTESLLDGARPTDVFSLPDPRLARRHRYRDSAWIAAHLTCVLVCIVASIVLLFTVHPPTSSRTDSEGHNVIPYITLLHTIPLLIILTLVSALFSYTHIFLLRLFIRPIMLITEILIPATLFGSAVWAFVGSFMWEDDIEPTWGESVGLRLLSVPLLLLSLWTGRRFIYYYYDHYREQKRGQHFHLLPPASMRTVDTLTLSTNLLMDNPLLLALSPVVLLATLLISIPFVTLIFRLLLVGSFTADGSSWKYSISPGARYALVGAIGTWLWTWAVARGILRVTCAGVIGAWYFDALSDPPPHTNILHGALYRGTHTSLGSVCLAGFLLSLLRLLALIVGVLVWLARALTTSTFLAPLVSHPIAGPVMSRTLVPLLSWLIGRLQSVGDGISQYALVYAGMTGQDFWNAARRSGVLTQMNALSYLTHTPARPLSRLALSTYVFAFPIALSTYLFVAHTLESPHEALGAAVLAGGVTLLVSDVCGGLISDVADTLYLCYAIDRDVGERRKDEVWSLFEPFASYTGDDDIDDERTGLVNDLEAGPSHPGIPQPAPSSARPRSPLHETSLSPSLPSTPSTRSPPVAGSPSTRPRPPPQSPPRHTPSSVPLRSPTSGRNQAPPPPLRRPIDDIDDINPFQTEEDVIASESASASKSATSMPKGGVPSPTSAGAVSPPAARSMLASLHHSASAPMARSAASTDADGSQYFPGSGLFT